MFSKIMNFLIIGYIIYTVGQTYTIYGLEAANTGNEISELGQNSENIVGICGFRDPESRVSPKNHSRFRRYILSGSKWEKNVITYRILNYTSTVNKSLVDEEFRRSFSEWSKYIPLNFTRIYEGQADIDILFQYIDGPFGVLAVASYPGKGTFIRMDDSEIKWGLPKTPGAINIRFVALHEIGHTLGLAHADNVGYLESVMNGADEIMQDDIDAVQELYGKREPNEKV